MALKLPHLNNESGFTLPELLSVMVVSLIFSGLIIYFAFDYWRATATLDNDSQTFVSRLTAGDKLRDNLNVASNLIIQNSINDTHTGNPDPAYASNYFWLPIHAVPGNTAVGASGTTTPLIYFQQPAVDSSKSFIMNGTQPYQNEFVLYLDGTTKQLLLRTLANSAAPSNAAVTSCPSSAATSICPADKIIAEDVASIDMRYFSRSGNTIDHNSIIDTTVTPNAYIGPDFPSVEVVEFNLHNFRKSRLGGGTDTSNQTVIRIALRNG
jgi:prepilin-type N-terminal cleavage/methylation domain-containing protein